MLTSSRWPSVHSYEFKVKNAWLSETATRTGEQKLSSLNEYVILNNDPDGLCLQLEMKFDRNSKQSAQRRKEVSPDPGLYT